MTQTPHIKALITAEVLRNMRHTGVERYTYELLRGLAAKPELDLTILCEKPEHAEGLPANLKRRYYRPPLEFFHPANRLLSYALNPPRDLNQFDVIHCPTVFAPFFKRPRGAKIVMTVHDLTPILFPEFHPLTVRIWFRSVLPRLMKMVDHFISVSECTKKDMLKIWGIEPKRITVIPHASRWETLAAPTTEPKENYILALGTIEPRKNLRRIIQAFLALKKQSPQRNEILKIVGRFGWERSDLRDLIEQHPQEIQVTGYLPDEQLIALYRDAKALVYVSMYEGFGLPVLEAMSLGCPVISSDNSSLPEVGGDAVLYADAQNISSITSAMQKLLSDSQLQTELCARGLERSRQFSWQRCADATADLYQRILS